MTKEEIENLRLNEISENSIAEWLYKRYRESGLNHKDAVKATVEGIQKMKSESIDDDTLRQLRQAIFKIPGMWVLPAFLLPCCQVR